MTNQKSQIHSSILIAAACSLYMVSGGIRANFGIIVQMLAAHAGVSYAGVSFAVAVGQLMYGLAQPFFGILALKKSNGFVLILGTLLMTCGLLLTPLASSQLSLIITVGLLFFTGTGAICFGIIMGTISPILGQTRASAASGILNASSGIGASLLSPVMQTLQVSIGVSYLLWFMGTFVLILIPVCLWLSKLSDENAGDKIESLKHDNVFVKLKHAISDTNYRRLMIGFSTCGFHMCIIQTHIYSQIVSYGLSDNTAALAYTVFGLTTIVGSIMCGFLCQRFSLKNILGSLYGIRALIVTLFILVMPKNIFSVFVFITVLGLTGDATVTPTSEVISRRFGAESLGLLFGITFVCHQIGGFFSSWLGGLFITYSGDYQIIWLIDIVFCAIASIASFGIF